MRLGWSSAADFTTVGSFVLPGAALSVSPGFTIVGSLEDPIAPVERLSSWVGGSEPSFTTVGSFELAGRLAPVGPSFTIVGALATGGAPMSEGNSAANLLRYEPNNSATRTPKTNA